MDEHRTVITEEEFEAEKLRIIARVLRGESFDIMRNGRVIAEIVPKRSELSRTDGNRMDA